MDLLEFSLVSIELSCIVKVSSGMLRRASFVHGREPAVTPKDSHWLPNRESDGLVLQLILLPLPPPLQKVPRSPQPQYRRGKRPSNSTVDPRSVVPKSR